MKIRNLIISLLLFSIKAIAFSPSDISDNPINKMDSLQAELFAITEKGYASHEVRDVVREMWKVDSTDPSVLMYHAYYFFRLVEDQQELSISFLDRILQQKPDDLYAHALKGVILNKLQKYEEAQDCLRKALESPPSDILPIQKWRVNITNRVYYIVRKKEDKDSLLIYYDLCNRLEPTSRVYASIANIYEDKKEYEKAIENYTHSLELYPEYYERYANRGDCYRHIGKFDKAIKDYTIYLDEKSDEDAYTYIARGNCYLENGKIRRGIADYKKALEIEDEEYLPYVNLAVAYYKLYQPQEAVGYMDKALEKEESENNYMYRAVMRVAAGYYEKAFLDFDKVDIPDKYYYMTLCHIMLKNKKEAILYLDKALEYLEIEYDEEYDLALHLFKYVLKIDWQQSLEKCEKLLSENVTFDLFPQEEFYKTTYRWCPNRKILKNLLARACQRQAQDSELQQQNTNIRQEGETYNQSTDSEEDDFQIPHYRTGWRAHHLLGRVKTVKTSTEDEIRFNQDGNVTYIKYKPYRSYRKYDRKDTYITALTQRLYINFPFETIRLEGKVGKWKEGNYYNVYEFTSSPGLNHKMLKWMAKDWDVELTAEYEHAWNWWKPFPTKEKITWTDREGNYEAHYSYKYIEYDEVGNWTRRDVRRVIYWHKDYTDKRTSEHHKYSHRDVMEYTEIAWYTYYEDEDIIVDYSNEKTE